MSVALGLQAGAGRYGAPISVELAAATQREVLPKNLARERQSAADHRPKDCPKPICSAQISHGHCLRAEVGALSQHAPHIGEAAVEPAPQLALCSVPHKMPQTL